MRVQPLIRTSGDLVADRRYQWAMDQAARGDPAAAADILQQTVEIAPGFAAAWFALGEARDALGDRAGAVAAFQSAAEGDPDDALGARLHLARLTAGEVAPAAMAAHTRRVFDHHAADFDEALRGRLGYRGPELLYEAIARVHTADGRPLRFGTALDLGCGTGLAGETFRAHVDWLVGIDISPAMIAQARAKGVYDRLIVADIADGLAAAGAGVHLMLAADVFVYIGDLAPVIATIASWLAPGGLLAFSVEASPDDDVVLQHTLRYAHGEAYVRAACARAGLAIRDVTPASTRTEKGAPVPGMIVVAQKPGAP